MDSSYFLISNNTNTSISSNDLEQSSSSFNYDPFDSFPFLDQQGIRLYADYFVGVGGGGGGGGGGAAAAAAAVSDGERNSPLSIINQCPLDQLDLQHHKNFPFQTDPHQENEDDLQGTLASFVGDLGVDSDAGYTSGVDLFSTNSIVDCSDPTEAYYLRLALEQNNNINNNGFNNINNDNNYSDINNNNNNNNYNSTFNNNDYNCNSYNSYNGDSNTNLTQTKRSVLMNLLIDGSDVGAGYTSHNCRALPQRINVHQQYQHQQSSSG